MSWTPGPAVVLLLAIATCNLVSVHATARSLTALGDQPDVDDPAVAPPESPPLAPSAPLAQAMRKTKTPGGGQTWCKVLPGPFVVLCDAAPDVCSSYQLPCRTDSTMACADGAAFCNKPGGFTWYVYSRQAGGIPECRCAQLCAAILQGRHGPNATCTSHPKAGATLQSAAQLLQEPSGPRAAAAYFMYVPPADEQPARAAQATAAAGGATAVGDDDGGQALRAGEAASAPAEDDGRDDATSSDSDADTPDMPGGPLSVDEGSSATPDPAAMASSGIIVCLPDWNTQAAPKPRHKKPPKKNKPGQPRRG